MKRMTFDASQEQPARLAPPRPTYVCTAHGCPLAGSISESGGDSPGFCAYHFGAPADRWQAITEAIARQHRALAGEIITARRYFAGMPGRGDSEGRCLLEAWQRLAPHGYDLNPATCIEHGGQRVPVTGYQQWASRCETLLGKLVGPLLAKLDAPGVAPSVPAPISLAEAIRQAGASLPAAPPRRLAAPPRQRDAIDDGPLVMPAVVPLPTHGAVTEADMAAWGDGP